MLILPSLVFVHLDKRADIFSSLTMRTTQLCRNKSVINTGVGKVGNIYCAMYTSTNLQCTGINTAFCLHIMTRTWEITTSTIANSQHSIQRECLYWRSFSLLETHNCGPVHSDSFPDTKPSSFGYVARSCLTACQVMKSSSVSALQRLCTASVPLDGPLKETALLFRTKQLQRWQRQTKVLQESNVSRTVVITAGF